MTSARTVKTLACLMAAMTALTLVLSLVEPWTLRGQSSSARADEPSTAVPVLASVPAAQWNSLELVLASQEAGKSASLPDAHLIIQSDGRIEATNLWRLGQPLPNHVLRVCAVYSGSPADTLLQRWLGTCNKAAQQTGMQDGRIRLSSVSRTRTPAQTKQLKDLQRRLSDMLRTWTPA